MSPEQAETIALQALGWLISNDELRDVFLNSTGGSASDLAKNADDPALLSSILDFLTMDDDWVVSFCDEAGLPYDQPMRARQSLPGAEQVHWT